MLPPKNKIYFTEKDLTGLNLAFGPVYEKLVIVEGLREKVRRNLREIQEIEKKNKDLEDEVKDLYWWKQCEEMPETEQLIKDAASDFLSGFYRGFKERGDVTPEE